MPVLEGHQRGVCEGWVSASPLTPFYSEGSSQAESVENGPTQNAWWLSLLFLLRLKILRVLRAGGERGKNI